MGVCIPISIKSQITRNISKKDIILTIFAVSCSNKFLLLFLIQFVLIQRSVKLFLIGLCLNTAHGPRMEDIRIMGVLQRFGIAYFVVATIHVIYFRPINILPNVSSLGWDMVFFVHLSHTPVMLIFYFKDITSDLNVFYFVADKLNKKFCGYI